MSLEKIKYLENKIENLEDELRSLRRFLDAFVQQHKPSCNRPSFDPPSDLGEENKDEWYTNHGHGD